MKDLDKGNDLEPISVNDYIYKLKYNPLSEMDNSWLDIVEYLGLFHNWRSSPRLNKWFVEKLGISDLDPNVFFQPGIILTILPKNKLKILLHYIGAALHSHNFKKVLIREQRNNLINATGEDTYKFCVNQVPHLLYHWPSNWHLDLPTKISSDYFIQYGLQFISVFFQEHDSKISDLLLYKLPYQLKDNLDMNFLVRDEQEVLANKLIKKIVKRVLPTCYHLLA